MLALFSSSGRADRREFWLYAVAPSAAVHGLTLLALHATGRTEISLSGTPAIPLAIMLFLLLALALATAARRLHDRDKSALWLVPYLYAPTYLSQAQETATDLPTLAACWIAVALMIWGLVDLGLLKGTPGPNHYGFPQHSCCAFFDVSGMMRRLTRHWYR